MICSGFAAQLAESDLLLPERSSELSVLQVLIHHLLISVKHRSRVFIFDM